MPFDWSTFFLFFLSIYSLFFNDPSPFARIQEEKSLLTLECLFVVD
jgi:hypothetical protein